MNSGTRIGRRAGAQAQTLANQSGKPFVVFYPRLGVGGNLHVECIPSWWEGKEIEWAKQQSRQGATVYWPANKLKAL